MNYRKALLSPMLKKHNNVDFVVVAPQGNHETSCDPKCKEFTIFKYIEKREITTSIIEIKKDEYILYMTNIGENLQVFNYKPTSWSILSSLVSLLKKLKR